ncbi:MAG: hypothetical protein QME88_02735 [Actinomycetota bacterium]|nr:hypothetical protein [Actinomycetota bacterium]
MEEGGAIAAEEATTDVAGETGAGITEEKGMPSGESAPARDLPVSPPPPPAAGISTLPPSGEVASRGKEPGRRKMLVAVLAIGFLLIAGAVAGVLTWRLTAGGGMVAEIIEVGLVTGKGKKVNLEDVPIGEDLTLTVKVKAVYGERGDAQLLITVRDETGEEQRRSRFKVGSSEKAQEFKDEFYFVWSEGERFTLLAELEVREEDKKVSDDYELEFYVAEGEISDEDAEAALKKAEGKLSEAEDAVIELGTSTDINVEDLLQRLIDANAALKEAVSLGEIDAVYREAEGIIAECSNRKAAWEEEQARKEKEQKQADGGGQQPNRDAEMTACKDAMFDYAWRQMVTTPFYAEPVRIDGFWMNDACTQAGGTMVGMKTAHTDPENAGNTVTVPISAHKENGRWVAVFETI